MLDKLELDVSRNQDNRGFVRLVILAMFALLTVGILYGLFCRSRQSHVDVYELSEEEGFIEKSNTLLQHAVAIVNESVVANCLDSLNKKYPALTFALPYDQELELYGGRTHDLRLVAIDPDYLSEDDRIFYFNSILPQLLSKQKKMIHERYFKISVGPNGDMGVSIGSVKLIAAMFKVPLEKHVWGGEIYGVPSPLLPEGQYCYISWARHVVPLPVNTSSAGTFSQEALCILNVDNASGSISDAGDDLPISVYGMWDKYFRKDVKDVCLNIGNGTISIRNFKNQKLLIRCDQGLSFSAYDISGLTMGASPDGAAQGGQWIDFSSDVVIVVMRHGVKIFELAVTHGNPMLKLSSCRRTYSGNERYTIDTSLTDKFCQQLVTGISNAMRFENGVDTIRLSIDPLLSLEMEKEFARYYDTLNAHAKTKGDRYELSLTVMDLATGNIVAAPFYRSADAKVPYPVAMSRKNPALLRRYIGSTFKPLLALTAVMDNPSLMNIATSSETHSTIVVDKVLDTTEAYFFSQNGQKLKVRPMWSKSGGYLEFWKGCPNFSTFFHRSDDVYPVALVALAMNGGSSDISRSRNIFANKNGYLNFSPGLHLENVRFFKYLDSLYEVQSYSNSVDSICRRMERYLWDSTLSASQKQGFSLELVEPEVTCMHYDSVARSFAAHLRPWVLGQGTNEWNSFKLAEAWSRMVTKRKVYASMQLHDHQPQPFPFSGKPEWNAMLEALVNAQPASGNGYNTLLPPMYDRVQAVINSRIANDDDKLVLYGKTGTPDDYDRVESPNFKSGRVYYDIGYYCMALMPRSAVKSVAQGGPARGLMCVIQVTRITEKTPSKAQTIGSGEARKFFSSDAARLLKFYNLTKSYLQP